MDVGIRAKSNPVLQVQVQVQVLVLVLGHTTPTEDGLEVVENLVYGATIIRRMKR